ncbi:MAG: adenosine deaminase [Pseudomonadota bacterium]
MTRSLTLLLTCLFATTTARADWFEALKQSGDDRALYRVLHAMPKGGDLHNHNSGSIYPEDWLEIAMGLKDKGYRIYTKVRINNCREYAKIDRDYLLMFRNIDGFEYDQLGECERSEHVPIEQMSDAQKAGWLESLVLDDPTEGRHEFFETHWQRMNALYTNPYARAESLIYNMRGLAEDKAMYLEVMVGVQFARRPDGSLIPPQEMIDILRERLQQPDAIATGVTTRLQFMVLRFTPYAEQELRTLYGLAVANRDLVVGLNMAGREDDDKGHPRRFVETYRELRQKHALPLSIHGGEVDEPNDHVRDTLLLGATRIGHGLNLITDDELMLDMRYGPYLIEINLISNLLLEYVVDYTQHPFPEYLRVGIPVALSTDDRGMWDSTLTDEFFVAVKEYNLTWDEVVLLSRNSLDYAFVEAPVKQQLRERFDRKIKAFERRMARSGLAKTDKFPDTRNFICARYSFCD